MDEMERLSTSKDFADKELQKLAAVYDSHVEKAEKLQKQFAEMQEKQTPENGEVVVAEGDEEPPPLTNGKGEDEEEDDADVVQRPPEEESSAQSDPSNDDSVAGEESVEKPKSSEVADEGEGNAQTEEELEAKDVNEAIAVLGE